MRNHNIELMQNQLGKELEVGLSVKDENQLSSTSVLVKVLLVVGCFFATILFLPFLFITGILNDEEVVLGMSVVLLVGSFVLTRMTDKITYLTVLVTAYFIGVFMFLYSVHELMRWDETMLFGVVSLLGLVTVIAVRNYILILSGALMFLIGLLCVLIFPEGSLHTFDFNWLYILTGLVSILFTYLGVNEVKLLPYKTHYRPIFIASLLFLVNMRVFRLGYWQTELALNPWLELMFVVPAIVYVLLLVFRKIQLTNPLYRGLVLGTVLLVLSGSYYYPPIAVAFLVMLVCFYINHKIGFSIGVLALVYSVSQYYYDMHFTLLTKSIMMIGTGVVFLLMYLFLYLNQKKNEEV